MNTNLDTKEAEIREQKKYKTQIPMKRRVLGEDFTVFKLISELIDQRLEEVLIKRGVIKWVNWGNFTTAPRDLTWISGRSYLPMARHLGAQ